MVVVVVEVVVEVVVVIEVVVVVVDVYICIIYVDMQGIQNIHVYGFDLN